MTCGPAASPLMLTSMLLVGSHEGFQGLLENLRVQGRAVLECTCGARAVRWPVGVTMLAEQLPTTVHSCPEEARYSAVVHCQT